MGVGLILPEEIRGHPYLGSYLAAYRGDVHNSMIEQETADFFGPYLSRYRYVICTEETFTHDFMPSRQYGLAGIDRADAAAEILSHTGAEATKVVLSIRPQFEFLTSTYTHFVHRHRLVWSYYDWLKLEVDPGRVLWTPAIEAFKQKFGDENVRAVGLSRSSGGISGYIENMLSEFGLAGCNLYYDLSAVHNQAPSDRAIYLCRIMNAQIANAFRSERVNDALAETFSVEEFGRFVPDRAALPQEIYQLYEEDFARALAA